MPAGSRLAVEGLLRLFGEFGLHVALRELARQPRTQPSIRQQPVERRALREAQVSIIAIVSAETDQSDRATQLHLQTVGGSVGLQDVVDEL
jgi:hypothetical protein